MPSPRHAPTCSSSTVARVGFSPLPLGQLEQIRSVPGVKVAIAVDLTGAMYQKPDQKMVVVAVRPDAGWLDAFTFTVSPGHDAAFRKQRTGMLALSAVVQKFGWKVGDKVPLMSLVPQRDGTSNWAFDDVGDFTDSDIGGQGDKVIVNYDYYNEARRQQQGHRESLQRRGYRSRARHLGGRRD